MIIFGPNDLVPIDLDTVWAELDAMGAADFLSEGFPDDPPVEPDPTIYFDD